MDKKSIDHFKKIQSQIESLHKEIGLLAKKSPNDALNAFKLGFVNQSIIEAGAILGPAYKPFGDFDSFKDEELPSNSDVTMILGQYLVCMEKLRADNGISWVVFENP